MPNSDFCLIRGGLHRSYFLFGKIDAIFRNFQTLKIAGPYAL